MFATYSILVTYLDSPSGIVNNIKETYASLMIARKNREKRGKVKGPIFL